MRTETVPAQPMNRADDGTIRLSREARIRLERQRKATDASDLPLPDLSDRSAVAAWRHAQHEQWGEGIVGDEVPHREVVIGGVRTLWAGSAQGLEHLWPTAVLYFHGGGFCLGSPGTSAPITARLARPDEAGRMLAVVSVDYRLAPEFPFPAALDDAERVARALLKSRRLAVGGDSAGASLAFGLWQRLGGEGVDALFGLSPLLDLGPTRGGATGPLLEAYIGRADPRDPLLSPAAMSDRQLATLPPVLVQSTSAEAVHRTVVEFVHRAETAGAPIVHQQWDGLWHAWHYHRELPEAWLALDLVAEFARSRLQGQGPTGGQA